MALERPPRRAPSVLTTSIAAFGVAAACRVPEPPPAAPTASNAPLQPQVEAPVTPASNSSDLASPPSPAASLTDTNSRADPVASNAPVSPTPQSTTANPKPAPAACGRMPGDKIEKLRWSFGQGNAECDRLETLWANVPHVDRVCKTDDDCTVVVSDGNCINLPLSKKAATRKEYQKAPCGNPVSGACMGHPNVPKCVAGCCGVQ